MNFKTIFTLGILSYPLINLCNLSYAEDYVTRSQINAANGVAGLNSNKEVTANINSQTIYTPFMLLPNTGSIRFLTGDSNPDNTDINFYYNRYANIDPWGNHLEKNTFYFTDHHGGNNYKFVGNVITTGNITANNLHVMLSTPSSSSAPCKAGDIKDDSNYHYVCVESNKWKRVALSDF